MRWIVGNGLLLFVAAAGCAGVNLYTDKELENETGFPIYTAKPYLLVKRTGTDASVSVDVVYLPDLENPFYAKQRVGIGKANFTVKITDGKVTEFTADADSKATEFTEALTAGLKSIADAFKTVREAELAREEARRGQAREELAGRLDRLADDMSKPEAADEAKTEAESLSDRLREQARILRDPASRRNEDRVADALEKVLVDLNKPRTRYPRAGAWSEELRGIIRELRAIAQTWARSTFELYEFRMQDGQTTLAPVKFPTGAARVPSSAG